MTPPPRKEKPIEIDIAHPEVWQDYVEKNKDGFGKAIISYAERWAKLMQVEMSAGAKLEDIAQKTSHDADSEGITGFMYGAAVQTLTQTWRHGEQLRIWHNLKTQLGNEGEQANKNGGVLNPAVLSIDVK